MKQTLLLISLSLLLTQSFGQQIEFFGGGNMNCFYSLKNPWPTTSSYKPGFGYSMGISILQLKLDTMKVRLSLFLDHYQGNIYTESSSAGSESYTDAKVKKTIIGLGLYPIKIKMGNKFLLDLGGEFNVRLSNETTGYQYSYYGVSKYVTLGKSPQINTDTYFAIGGRFCYLIALSPDWNCLPTYSFSVGMNTEFKNIESYTKSFKQRFQIGFYRNLR